MSDLIERRVKCENMSAAFVREEMTAFSLGFALSYKDFTVHIDQDELILRVSNPIRNQEIIDQIKSSEQRRLMIKAAMSL